MLKIRQGYMHEHIHDNILHDCQKKTKSSILGDSWVNYNLILMMHYYTFFKIMLNRAF